MLSVHFWSVRACCLQLSICYCLWPHHHRSLKSGICLFLWISWLVVSAFMYHASFKAPTSKHIAHPCECVCVCARKQSMEWIVCVSVCHVISTHRFPLAHCCLWRDEKILFCVFSFHQSDVKDVRGRSDHTYEGRSWLPSVHLSRLQYSHMSQCHFSLRCMESLMRFVFLSCLAISCLLVFLFLFSSLFIWSFCYHQSA